MLVMAGVALQNALRLAPLAFQVIMDLGVFDSIGSGFVTTESGESDILSAVVWAGGELREVSGCNVR